MESDGDENVAQNAGFSKQGGQPKNYKQIGGEALNLDDDGGFNDSEDVDDSGDVEPQDMRGEKKPSAQKGAKPDVKGEKLENQPYDLAVDVNDSEEIESEEEDDEVNMNDVQRTQAAQQNPAAAAGNKAQPLQSQPQVAQKRVDEDDDGDDDDKHVPGTYNPNDYAGLQVSHEIKELFEYIARYKPQKVELETKLKPFIPDFVPAVGEVDACLKMNKPDGSKEDLGILQLDEPALNCEDKTVLELKYVQSKNVVRATPVSVDSIESAEKKPKEVSRWINSVQDLHKSRPAPTVSYTKQMPDFDALMAELPPELEQALQKIQFPGAEIDMHPHDYARLVLGMLDVPVHKLANNKSLIESLHVLFTLFSEFRQNQHFKNQENGNGMGAPDIPQY